MNPYKFSRQFIKLRALKIFAALLGFVLLTGCSWFQANAPAIAQDTKVVCDGAEIVLVVAPRIDVLATAVCAAAEKAEAAELDGGVVAEVNSVLTSGTQIVGTVVSRTRKAKADAGAPPDAGK